MELMNHIMSTVDSTCSGILVYGGTKLKEATLYCLYMMSDGALSPKEKKMFAQICKKLGISDKQQHIILTQCQQNVTADAQPAALIHANALDNETYNGAAEEKGNADSPMLATVESDAEADIDADKANAARVIWNLVNLGYADGTYSVQEQEIVQHLLNKWHVKSEVYAAMIDTAETIGALSRQKEQTAAVLPAGTPERKRKLSALTAQMRHLVRDMTLTIQEAALY